jgi:hypothetical protein
MTVSPCNGLAVWTYERIYTSLSASKYIRVQTRLHMHARSTSIHQSSNYELVLYTYDKLIRY